MQGSLGDPGNVLYSQDSSPRSYPLLHYSMTLHASQSLFSARRYSSCFMRHS
jgi:hypothetical protein